MSCPAHGTVKCRGLFHLFFLSTSWQWCPGCSFYSLTFSPFLISQSRPLKGPQILSDPFSFLPPLPFYGICCSCHIVSLSVNPNLHLISTSLPGSLLFFPALTSAAPWLPPFPQTTPPPRHMQSVKCPSVLPLLSLWHVSCVFCLSCVLGSREDCRSLPAGPSVSALLLPEFSFNVTATPHD